MLRLHTWHTLKYVHRGVQHVVHEQSHSVTVHKEAKTENSSSHVCLNIQ